MTLRCQETKLRGSQSRLVIFALALLLVGCNRPDPNMPMREQAVSPAPVGIETQARVEVTRIGVFADNLAYDGLRGVYLIKDSETGAEFIGISGVGISAIGHHGCGKGCTTKDER